MTKRKEPQSDSIKANTAASRKMAELIDSGIVKPHQRYQRWYNDPAYKSLFHAVHPDKFRKTFDYAVKAKHGADKVKTARAGKSICTASE